MQTLNKKLIFLTVLFLFSFAITQTSFAMIERDEIMGIAGSYEIHPWTPTEDNKYHEITIEKGCKHRVTGAIVDCRIDTPDAECESFTTRDGIVVCNPSGWWEFDQENIGLPYQWGGFSSLDGFDRGYQGDENGENKKYAGDIYCHGNGRSAAVGVDCSGFVSRAWDQSVKYGTSSILKISRELGEDFEITDKDKYLTLKKGDALNKSGYHIMLFEKFDSVGSPEEVWVYEASDNDWKVSSRAHIDITSRNRITV